MHGGVQHIHEIERVLSGGRSGRDVAVVESWRRCVVQHGLDPARQRPAYIMPDGPLRERREQAERLIAIARSGLEDLYRQVAGQSYVLLLADAEGVTVDFFGDASVENELRRAGLYLGAVWSEDTSGTCGIGSCIATGRAVTIHQTDHFDLTHTPLSCTAAPIFSTDGRLVAALDISQLSSPAPKISQRLAMHLVSATVRRIELANLMATMRQHWMLRLSHAPDFLDIDPEAAVAVSETGRIVGLTHGAQRLLSRSAGVDWRQPGAIVGQPLSRFFELSADDLPRLLAGRPTQERLVRLGDGAALFGHVIAPLRAARRSVPDDPIPAPLRALSGDDPRMRAIQRKAARLADGPLPILLRGETGAGKERLARAIHAARETPGPFVAVNCAALPESLIEGELFGHAPGAFSGALSRGRAGLIEAADGGVLFLDEIGDMPLSLQARLLRVLSEGVVTRLGEVTPRPVTVKIISATHRDLQARVQRKQFRADLFFRLAAVALHLPPLRDRADFEWLLDALLKQRAQQLGASWILSPSARLALRRRRWPGNLRELINTLDVAIALSDSEVITPHDLPPPPMAAAAPAAPVARGAAAALREVLVACDWNVSQVARRLGIDRSTVHRRMRRYGLQRPS